MSEMMTKLKPRKGFKPDFIVVAGGAVAAGGYILYRRRAANASAATTDTVTAGSPDDSSGYIDGSDYDSDYSTAGYGNPGAVLSSYTDPATDSVISGAGTTIYAPTTNAQWAQQATAYLSNEGYDSTAVLGALGKYLAGLALSSSENIIVQSAIGAEGYPPNGAPTVKLLPASGQSSGTKVTSLKAPKIGVAGKTDKVATISLVSASPNAQKYQLYRNGKYAHENTNGIFPVAVAKKKNVYTIIAAASISGKTLHSPPSNSVSA